MIPGLDLFATDNFIFLLLSIHDYKQLWCNEGKHSSTLKICLKLGRLWKFYMNKCHSINCLVFTEAIGL